ncbi:hypothetical protein C2E25_06980 [Geothermobacter hydrogeniphilus]|uniref:ABC-type transport auxiliary lipoprotein component domain-containing protein n=1 Tax=Geothermobacter hydrogeniphilus TaxID=1969733 RepID=A0A2K2HB16_9BACT|nr:PqiC family protein [Geothermobacter hydrogeniphilus]PNU20457.1 hypothetical protein C2E25_06980 [Geothermobacter hydrogeniphilus]
MRPLLFLLLLGLAGCVNIGQGTTPSRHYLIPSLADKSLQALQRPATTPSLSLAPVTLAGYLDRPQLVRRRGNRLEMAPFDRWGEPLDEQVRRVIGENLDRLLSGLQWKQRDSDYRLAIDLQRLDAASGQARLQLSWLLEDRSGKLLAQGSFDKREPLTDDSAETLVARYGSLLEMFSRDLARQLAQRHFQPE